MINCVSFSQKALLLTVFVAGSVLGIKAVSKPAINVSAAVASPDVKAVAAANLEGLVKTLDSKTWAARLAEMKPRDLTLLLPRFKAEYTGRLRGPLSSLGMKSAFQPGADFLPMGSSRWFIGNVIHEAVLDVDEKGTTAAAATAVIMTKSAAALPPSTVMRVDRPFFLAIRGNATGMILFEGVIRDLQ
ncbi:MAG: serpin family protein [Janthinobacterium lividum]